MQRQKTYWIRNAAYQVLLHEGLKSLSDLAEISGISKEELRYAIESTEPFGAVFRKIDVNGVTLYESVDNEDVYGEENFY